MPEKNNSSPSFEKVPRVEDTRQTNPETNKNIETPKTKEYRLFREPVTLEDAQEQMQIENMPCLFEVTARREGYVRLKNGKTSGWAKEKDVDTNSYRTTLWVTTEKKSLSVYGRHGDSLGEMTVDGGNPPQVLEAYIWRRGHLLNKDALKDSSPSYIEECFSNLEIDDRNGLAADAVFSASQDIIRCSKGFDIILKAAKEKPYAAFRHYEKYKDATFATSILQVAAQTIGNPARVNALLTSIPAFRKMDTKTKKMLRDSSVKNTDTSKTAKSVIDGFRMGEADVLEFAKDPALILVSAVKEEWIDWHLAKMVPDEKPSVPSERWKASVRSMIARNLYFQKLDITETTVRAEFKRIMLERKRYGSIPLFKNRNTIFAAHSELISDTSFWLRPIFRYMSGGKYTFGKKRTLLELEKQKGSGTLRFSRPEKNKESLLANKKAILDRFRNSEPPTTFVFAGHGSPEGLYLDQGENIKDLKGDEIRITAKELAEVIRERSEQYPHMTNNASRKDIIVLLACYNATFIRNVYAELKGATHPIMLGSAEYNQMGIVKPMSEFESDFMEKTLNLGGENAWQHEKGVTTIDDVFVHEFESETNPSLYIPDDQGNPMQIAQKNEENTLAV